MPAARYRPRGLLFVMKRMLSRGVSIISPKPRQPGSCRRHLPSPSPRTRNPEMSSLNNLARSLGDLKISTRKPKAKKEQEEEVLDSWDAASLSSDSEPEADPIPKPASNVPKPASSPEKPASSPPPPTPSTPDAARKERPATTDAVARRMIAAALGVRTKSTTEQRAFDKAVREKEKKKRDEERERRREDDKREEEAKRMVWED